MSTSLQPSRHIVLNLLAVTAVSWWGPARAQGHALPQLRIGFQNGSLNLALLKSLGLLEKRVPSSKIAWVEFPAGPQLLEVLAVGSVDFGAAGDSPPAPGLVAEQQRVADSFPQLGLVRRPIRVADIVWQPRQALALAR